MLGHCNVKKANLNYESQYKSQRTASLNDMEQKVMVGNSTASEVLLVTVVPISIFCSLITEISIRLTKYAKRARVTNFDDEVAMFGGQTPDGK